jgi:pimeloyl-ACP methyl ester carboxylesterase
VLDVLREGTGPPVVFVHGSVLGAARAWRAQRELAERWQIVMPDRPGFGNSETLARGDFEAEAPLFAELLGGGAHLVGHSYGAVIALYAAALAPQAVRSLTLSEPGCLRVAAERPAVARQLANGARLYANASRLSEREFLQAFRGGAGVTRETPKRLDPELARGARLLIRERPAWEAEPDWAALRAAPFAKLVISGGHSAVFEAVCDAVAARIGAQRTVLAGRGHTIPAADGYNELLEGFLASVERAPGEPGP